MVSGKETLPKIIRQVIEEDKLKEEVSRKGKELFVKYYNLLARYGEKRLRKNIYGVEVEVPINKNMLRIQVYSERYGEFLHLPKKITTPDELGMLGMEAIVVDVEDVDELRLNREGNILHGREPRLFLSTLAEYEELCEFLDKELSRRGGGSAGGAGILPKELSKLLRG
jgi:hypothetical protein